MESFFKILSGKPKNGKIMESMKLFSFIQLAICIVVMYIGFSIYSKDKLVALFMALMTCFLAWQTGWGMSIQRFFNAEDKKVTDNAQNIVIEENNQENNNEQIDLSSISGKLFVIKFKHYCKKDTSEVGIREYIFAKDDKQIFDYLNSGRCYTNWDYGEDEPECILERKDKLLKNKGNRYEEPSDLYYGFTHWWWEEVPVSDEEIIKSMIKNLLVKSLC